MRLDIFIITITLVILNSQNISAQQNNFTNNLAFEEVKINPYLDNELRAIASVTLTDTANVYFRYRNMEEDATVYLYTKVSERNKNHTLTLTTLKQKTNYKIEAIAFNKNNFITIDTFTYTTKNIDGRLDNFENHFHTGLYTTPQYTITNLPAGQESYFIATDLLGNTVWYHKYNVEYNNCNAWRLTEHNTILYATCKEITEIDFFGNVLRNITIEQPNWFFHHDVRYLSNGNLAVIYAQPETVTLNTGEEEIVIVDGYLVFNKQNEIVYNWKASDFFDAREAKFMGGYWIQIIGQRTYDWCHFNAIAEDFDGNILISASHWSKIIKVNRFNGEVIWELGEEGTLQKDSTFQIHRQHSIEPISPNKYLLFDNLGNNGASRAVEFAVDTNTNFAFPFWQYAPQETITSPTRGNIQRLTNGNTLVFFPTNRGLIHEVNTIGQLVWKIELAKSGYRAYRLPYLVEPHQQVSIEISDTLCSSEISIELITDPVDAYISGDAVIDGDLVTEGLEGTMQTITAVYGNNIIEKKVFISPKENNIIEVNDSILQISEVYHTYQWFFENTPILNETNAILTPTEDGQYFVSYPNKYGCINYSDTINFVKTSILNVDENVSYKVITNNKTIEIYSFDNQPKNVELFTLEGKLIVSKTTSDKNYEIPMHNYSGLLIIKIMSDEKSYTKKIVL